MVYQHVHDQRTQAIYLGLYRAWQEQGCTYSTYYMCIFVDAQYELVHTPFIYKGEGTYI